MTDNQQDILAKLGQGDMDAFVARCANDPAFPFEPEALGALIFLVGQNLANYERLRTRLKDETKVRLAALDNALKKEAAKLLGQADTSMSGRPIRYDDIEPWEEEVNGAELLTETAAAISAYVVMDAPQRDAAALWAFFAHTHDLRDYAPFLIILSPTKRCGKSTLQRALTRLVPRPQPTSGVTPALFPRLVEKHRPTLFIDEFDAISTGEAAEFLRGLLNSSVDRASATVIKLAPTPGGDWDGRVFSLWTPASIAGIGKPSETVIDRSVVIRLIRKLTAEKVKRLRGRDGAELAILRRKIARWVIDSRMRLETIEPPTLDRLNDRQADAWEPLFAIADVAGGEWPGRARAAAAALCQADNTEALESETRLVLLADIRDIFAQAFPPGRPAHKAKSIGRPDDGPRLPTSQLLRTLLAIEERPWNFWGRSKKPMTDTELAAQLRPYGVRSSTIRPKGQPTARGYYLRSFEDAFTHYLPDSGQLTRHIDTNPEKQGESGRLAADTNYPPVTAKKPSNSGVCVDVSGAGEDTGEMVCLEEGIDGALADAIADLTPPDEWVLTPAELLAEVGPDPDFPKNSDDLVAGLKRSKRLLLRRGVTIAFLPANGAGLIVLARTVERAGRNGDERTPVGEAEG
jgi:putative DNA primase/helicase